MHEDADISYYSFGTCMHLITPSTTACHAPAPDSDSTSSSLSRRPPCHVSIAILQSSAEQYGLYMWPSSLVLAQYVWRQRESLCGRFVVELGSGTGLPGILAARLGANVSLTDAESKPEVLANLRAICALNNVTCQVSALSWGSTTSGVLANILPFSADIDGKASDFLILGADVLYSSEAFEPLLATVHAMLHKGGPGSLFVTAYQWRSGHRSIEFLLQKWGIQVVTLRDGAELIPKEDQDSICGAPISLVEMTLMSKVVKSCGLTIEVDK